MMFYKVTKIDQLEFLSDDERIIQKLNNSKIPFNENWEVVKMLVI